MTDYLPRSLSKNLLRYGWLLFVLLIPELGFGAEGAEGGGHHKLSPKASPVIDWGFIQITNSMIMALITSALIIAVAQIATRDIKWVPSGLQNFVEWIVESLFNFLSSILGDELTKKTFWFFGSVFIFILFNNWLGLIPGVGTMGWGYVDAAGHFHLSEPWLRGAAADLNLTASLALLFFVFWFIWAIQANGVGGFIHHIFGNKAPGGAMFAKLAMALVFIFVGVLETISILFRPVALMFRLYGNVFAGENILESMLQIAPAPLNWIIPLPFYGLELLVGFVQALVFTLLTAVFTLLICSHDDHEEGGAH